MPTHQDETLQQRYAREHQEHLALCGSMTAEQVADLQLQLNNALEREAVLQQRLNAADQRNDELQSELTKARDALTYLHEQFESEITVCDCCGDERPTSEMDSAHFLREYFSNQSTPAACVWSVAEFTWQSGCGKEWVFHDDGPIENGMKFCHSCGKHLEVASVEKDSE